jgi:hypothetical protein
MERIPVMGRDLRAAVDQQLDHFSVFLYPGVKERTPTIFVFEVDQAGIPIEQLSQELDITMGGGFVNRWVRSHINLHASKYRLTETTISSYQRNRANLSHRSLSGLVLKQGKALAAREIIIPQVFALQFKHSARSLNYLK